MIKVNLNKTKSAVTYNTHSTGLASTGSTIFTSIKKIVDGNEFNFQPVIVIKLIVNISLIFCFPLGLKIYEMNQINHLETEKQKANVALAGVREKLSVLQKELEGYSHLQDKSKEFLKKKEFLKNLAESRLIIPRTVDLIQNKIPKTVWLEHLRMEINQKNNKLEIFGKSFNEAHVNAFARSLHDIMDKNSITVNTRDIKESNSVIKVDFNLKGVM